MKKIMKTKTRQKRKLHKTAVEDNREARRFLFVTGVTMAVFMALNFISILWLQDLSKKYIKKPAAAAVAAPAPAINKSYKEKSDEMRYRNPELEKMKDLKIGGEIEKPMPVFEKLKFTMSDEPVFGGENPVYSLSVCCPGGLAKEFYTAKMPWAFIMYEYEQGLPTVTVFEMDKGKKQGRFEIVVLDAKADMEKLMAVSVGIYAELLKAYMPGYEWRGSVRQEIN